MDDRRGRLELSLPANTVGEQICVECRLSEDNSPVEAIGTLRLGVISPSRVIIRMLLDKWSLRCLRPDSPFVAAA